MNRTARTWRMPVIISLILISGIFAPTPYLSARTEVEPGQSSPIAPSAAAATSYTDRIIVKFKPTASLQGTRAPNQPERLHELSTLAGTALGYVRRASNQAHILRLASRLPVSEVRRIADRLMTNADVLYAEPDAVRQHTMTPNDTYYSLQWDLWDTYGIDAPGAWDSTTGAASIVVADVDTGITSHPEFSGRLVPGYDFVSDPIVANDGDGWDADPSDPGDWVSSADLANPIFSGCAVENSSWHGTHTAGTIGATGNNASGVAGINWTSKILPVRVLGKCFGYDSDIIDGMRWAAGLAVPGAPPNPNPAKVLNLSLGGSGACDTSWQTAINDITAAGATIVVAAGNENKDASNDVPANCSGVIVVAATNRNGDKAAYSNFGSSVTISAPGGDSGNKILSTYNSGTTVPGSPVYGYLMGTSMATPHVTGVVSLLYSRNPSLTSAQIRAILHATARPFPSGSTCSTSLCGAGIVDAASAVHAIPGITGTSPASVIAGSSAFTLTVTGANFFSDSVVKWDGAPRTTTFLSSIQVQAAIAGGDISSSGSAQITVVGTSPILGPVSTNACTFDITAALGPNKYFFPFVTAGGSSPGPPPTPPSLPC